MRSVFVLTSILTLLPFVGSGCAVEFESYHEITKLRVLSVTADPPAFFAGETVTFEVLVADPTTDDAPSVTWELCPLIRGAEDAYACYETSAGELVGVELGQGTSITMTVDNAFVEQLGEVFTRLCDVSELASILSEVCSNTGPGIPNADPPDGGEGGDGDASDGLDTMVLRAIVESGGEQVVAFRDVDIGFVPTTDRNVNPALLGITADVTREDALTHTPLGDGSQVEVVLGPERYLDLVALVNEDAAEVYDEEGEEQRESLRLTWFSTAGHFSKGTGYYYEGIAPIRELQNTRLYLEDEDFSDGVASVRIYAVLRDDRGGQTFWWSDIIAR